VLPLILAAAVLCPGDMAAVPEGTWTFGASDGQASEPVAQRPLSAFCIDRFEYPNELGVLPLVEVSWAEARERCAVAGKRLCSSDEWERACRGPGATRYAYGDAFDRDRCNTPLPADGPGADDIPYATAGARPTCVSAEGAFDLNGNVSEWVADAWDTDRFGAALGQGPGDAGAALRELRGGTMWSGTFYGQSCLSRHAHPAGTLSDDDGFRCCADGVAPESLFEPLPPVAPRQRTWPIGAGLLAALAAIAGAGRLLSRSRTSA